MTRGRRQTRGRLFALAPRAATLGASGAPAPAARPVRSGDDMRGHTNLLPGLVVTSHEFSLPLDHARPDGERIAVFAREVVAPARRDAELPWLVFFQGGPGFAALRPEGGTGWLGRALADYRVLLLDQRGTGGSSPVSRESLARFASPREQAEYLMHFRQDSFVADAEAIRRELLGEGKRWTALGQSFGGFCVTRYLSAAPEGLEAAIITGGLPPLDRGADDIYRETYRRVLAKNRRYFVRYPEDAARTRAIADHLAANDVRLPGGGRLSARRFQQLGIAFGASDGFEKVHYLLEGAFGPDGRLAYSFLRGFENAFSFETNPIYALLQEAEYCQGEASNWSAERIRGEHPELDASRGGPLLFTGEMVYPWMFEEYEQLAPLAGAADLLARHRGWPRLYDAERLRANTVPAAAAVYYDDMYVERKFSEETAAAIGGLKVWVTSELEHNGLRAEGERVLGRLLGMLAGAV